MKTGEGTYSYVLILTHDVDYLSLRAFPFFSKAILSFIKNSIFNNFIRFLRNDISVNDFLDSLKNALLLPLIKIGWISDPWEKSIQIILNIEKKYNVRSTFYFIPFSNNPGHIRVGDPAPRGRATQYNMKDYKSLLHMLEMNGWEVSIHGIDAHIDLESAKLEFEVLKELMPKKEKIGIRMHWLYTSEKLLDNVENAGFYYESTLGYNEKIGFPFNKHFPFQQEGKNIWTLPLNVQDGALLAKCYKNLSQNEAWIEIKKILIKAKAMNCVITILWHNTSFVAPRYWGSLYEKIIQKAKADEALILRAIDIIELYKSTKNEHII